MDDLAWLKPVIIFSTFGLLFIAERLRPAGHRPDKAGTARLISNISLGGFNTVLSPLIVLPITATAAAMAPSWRPAALDGWIGIGLDLLILDLWIYWWHRANHRIPFLWRFHEVHHLDEFLDVTSSARFHFGELFLSAIVRGAVIIALDISLSSVLIFSVLVTLNAAFHHCNVRLPERLERLLRRVIVTPSHHWVHHHNVRRDTDSNYSTILTMWDRLFGTWSETKRWPDMPIGTEGRTEKPLPGLIVRPLQKP
ncbi:sterol desaturase family protein [Parvularcula sp. LCG005]|uniref:sterol desaturase family protein n=1 Tax=Parvularcula sp. LCG005 TaxID=3078805 RepID=UPI0029433296|nr:sterol desaturase family protein [Parvularcula sp. LCG005]WOI52074.1 sterol desaturase family protein [Parvularcula sp. LCG005]